MSEPAQPMVRVYRLLLACYPAAVRAQFGEEMEDVFASALAQGERRSWQLLWRELRDWPGSLLQAHLRVRRRKMATNRFAEEKPPSRTELLAALLIFILPLLSPYYLGPVPARGRWQEILLIILFMGALLLGLGLAIVKRLPRWSLPYLGSVLLPAALFAGSPRGWGWLFPRFTNAFGPRGTWSLRTHILYSAVAEFVVLFLILAGALVLVNVLRLLPFARGVSRGIRADWTALSFLLYGGLVLFVPLLFDEYRYDNGWKFLAWIALAAGAWLYLRAKGQKQRLLASLGGATAAMWIVAVAKWVLIPLQQWPTGYSVAPSEATRWYETAIALVSWAGVMLLLLAPTLLTLLPPAGPTAAVPERGKPVTT
jgi:hypothetical protein